MAFRNHIPPEVRQAILRYLTKRLDAAAISSSAAMKEVRESVREGATITDEELLAFIVETADDAGFGISFDGRFVEV